MPAYEKKHEALKQNWKNVLLYYSLHENKVYNFSSFVSSKQE